LFSSSFWAIHWITIASDSGVLAQQVEVVPATAVNFLAMVQQLVWRPPPWASVRCAGGRGGGHGKLKGKWCFSAVPLRDQKKKEETATILWGCSLHGAVRAHFPLDSALVHQSSVRDFFVMFHTQDLQKSVYLFVCLSALWWRERRNHLLRLFSGVYCV
jgi:hypothetical protein